MYSEHFVYYQLNILLQEKDFLVETLVPLMPSLGERSQKVFNVSVRLLN